jgi:hypothetical protein
MNTHSEFEKLVINEVNKENERWTQAKKRAEGGPVTKPKNLVDLDAYILQNVQTDKEGRRFLMSRYDALKKLYGVTRANRIMRELEVASW